MTIKTKRASRSVPAEPSDGMRLLIVLKPSSAWRQGIPYDKPHVPELAPDDALFDKYVKNIKSHKWTEEEWSGYEEAFRKLMMEREKAQELMRSLAKEYANSDTKHVTLLCFCPNEKYCHRRLVKEMILSIYQSYMSSRK
jgi:uncharacterized protein YeaO (DUF488 family)